MREEIPVVWSEDLELPICEYCQKGRKCMCGAVEADKCTYCEEGCSCGYEQVINGEVCDCECDCGEDESGNCEDCCMCGYPIADDLPDQCYCECECEPCVCRCSCPVLIIDADSYNDWVQRVCYVCPPECLIDEFLEVPDPPTPHFVQTNGRCFENLGSFQFYIRTLPHYVLRREVMGPTFMGMPLIGKELQYQEFKELTRLAVIQDGYKSLIRFSGPVHIPVLSQAHPYKENESIIWMSLTPMEVLSQMPGYDLAGGNVLVGGLGMGWLTKMILDKPSVNHVTQIELNPEILDFFGSPLRAMYPRKLDLVRANVWEFLEEVDVAQFDAIILDIWPKYNDARRDKNFKILKEAYPRVWGWGEVRIKNSDR